MRLLTLSHKKFLIPLGSFLLGALLVFGIQKVLADTTIINACVDSKTGAVRIITGTQTCTSKETPLSWNQTGPQGIQGPPGPTGLPGSNGGLFSNKPFVTCYCDLSAYADQFQGKDWTNTQTFGIILKNVDVHGVNFSGSVLGVTFDGDNLTGANFSSLHTLSGDTTTSMTATNSNLTNVNFSNNTFQDSSFSGSDLSNEDFSGQHFFRVDFGGTNLSGANFSNITPDRTIFTNAILNGTNFSNAVIGGNTTFEGSDMTNTIRDGIDWGGAICPDGTFASEHPDNNNQPTCEGHLVPTPTPTP